MAVKRVRFRENPVAWAATMLIRVYQRCISPFLGVRCRFYPTCSQYALEVITEWGFFKGTALTVKRLVKCGPWHEGGVDLPPCRNGYVEAKVCSDREIDKGKK